MRLVLRTIRNPENDCAVVSLSNDHQRRSHDDLAYFAIWFATGQRQGIPSNNQDLFLSCAADSICGAQLGGKAVVAI